MGKNYQGVFGNWSGKTGNVVGREYQGRTIYSIYQPNVLNPKTVKQESQRQKFKLYATLASRCKAFLEVAFHNLDGYRRGSWFSSFVGYNFKHDKADPSHAGISGTYPNQALNYPNIQFSPMTGGLATGANIAGSINENTITISWEDESESLDNANANDHCMVLVISETKRSVISLTAAALRSTRLAQIELPLDWEGETVQVYCVFANADYTEFSSTQFIGALS